MYPSFVMLLCWLSSDDAPIECSFFPVGVETLSVRSRDAYIEIVQEALGTINAPEEFRQKQIAAIFLAYR